MQRPPNLVGVQLGGLVKTMSKGKVIANELAKELDLTNFLERDVNVGFSGGEIKRSELFQLTAQCPSFVMLDEPESGVDIVSISKVGAKVHDLIQGTSCAGKRDQVGKGALVITHTGQILDYINADRGYVMCKGTVACAGNPRELLAEIRSKGYDECISCNIRRRQARPVEVKGGL
jgi:Fe-S cluster assembly ATP-binding protein